MTVVNSSSKTKQIESHKKKKCQLFLKHLAYFFGLHHVVFVLISHAFLITACCFHKVQSHFTRQTIRYSEYSLISEAYWLWSAKLDMTPLGAGQHFCLGLVKFMELVHQILLAQGGPA